MEKLTISKGQDSKLDVRITDGKKDFSGFGLHIVYKHKTGEVDICHSGSGRVKDVKLLRKMLQEINDFLDYVTKEDAK